MHHSAACLQSCLGWTLDPCCSLVSSSDSAPGSISYWLCPSCGSGAPLAFSRNADGPIELCPPRPYPVGMHPVTAQAGVTLIPQLVLPQGEAVPYCPGQWAVLSLQCGQSPPSSTPRNMLPELSLSFPPLPFFSLHWLSMTGTCLKILLVCWDVHLMFLTRPRIYSKGGKTRNIPSENLGTYFKSKCSILLLSLQRETASENLGLCLLHIFLKRKHWIWRMVNWKIKGEFLLIGWGWLAEDIQGKMFSSRTKAFPT